MSDKATQFRGDKSDFVRPIYKLYDIFREPHMKKKPLQILIVILITSSIMGFAIFKKENKEDKFWNWFVKNQETYYNQTENNEIREKIFDELSNKLKEVNPDLVFEFSPKRANGIRELTISADGIREAFPAVESLIKKSPELKNWKFNAFRQRTRGNDFEIQYGDLKIGYSDIYFKSKKDNGKLNIQLNIRDFNGKAQTQNAIYILLDNLLGEYDVETKIGGIDWVKLDENNKENLKPFIELRDAIDK